MSSPRIVGTTRHRRALTAAIGLAVVALGSGASLRNVQAAQSFTAPTWTLQIGQQGSAFVYPWGMAWDPVSGTILTTDYNNYQVQRFTTAGVPDGMYSSKVALGGNQPYGIAVDPTTDDFLVDDLGGYLRYSSTGVLLNTVDAHADGVHYAPWIAVNPTTGTVYLVNSNSTTGPNMVLMFDKNDNYLSQFGVRRQELRQWPVRAHSRCRHRQRRQRVYRGRQQPLRRSVQQLGYLPALLQHQGRSPHERAAQR